MRVPSGASVPGFSHTIQVDKNLVRLLSDQTYTSFTNCIRELVVNAHDADATQVAIEIDAPSPPGAAYEGSLTIMDNGHGMTAEQFVRYTRIAPGGPPRERSRVYGRPRVGRFGIGYLAAFPFCERMELRTSAGDEEIVANFNCAAYFRRAEEFVGLDEVRVQAQLERRRSSHLRYRTGTHIHLKGLSREAIEYLQLSPPEPRKGRKVESIWDWSGTKRLAWELGQVLPIRWGKPYQEWQKALGIPVIKGDPGLSVSLNGRPIEKPWPELRSDKDELTRLAPEAGKEKDRIITPSEEDGSAPGSSQPQGRSFSYRYLAITPHRPIEPAEFRGVQLRLRGVGLGPPIPYKQIPGFTGKENELIRVFIEVHLTGGFDEQLTLDRSQLKRSPWLIRLFRDLEQQVFAKATRHVLSEARLARDLDQLKKVNQPGFAGTKENAIERVRRHASDIGYELEYAPVELSEAHIDHTRNAVVVPAPERLPNPRIPLGGRDYEVIEGSGDDARLRRDWVWIQQAGSILVSRRLAQIAGNSRVKYTRLLYQLAAIEWRRFELSQGKDAIACNAMAELARAIKNDLVKER